MKKNIIDNSDKILREMFSTMSAEDFKIILNFIDDFIIKELKVNKEQLPWITKSEERNEWLDAINLIRLAAGRLFSEIDKWNYKPTKH
jgi:DNA-directed RNA polymerase subunit H (RpoH/RPB5)